ncbi:myozenin-1-like [Acipenser ruthenus]|uniref:myozenin-1-like n=1 Tax=Acipenser ruthenus TaxID=7906 RepID=UPI002740A5B2|nr:myozenin-1-like [Acipenser ruthenus]
MPLSGTPAPNKRKKSTKAISEIMQGVLDEGDLNLGKKISTPKDIMLEELSLLGNKGSKMFKLRQKRVERFIWENNPDIFNDESMDNFQKFVPSLGGAMQSGHSMMDVGGHLVSGQMVGQAGTGRQQQAPVPPPKPGMGGAGGGAGGAGGGAGGARGGAGGDVTMQTSQGHGEGEGHQSGGKDGSKQSVTMVRTYISPWERAMRGNAELTATMRSSMPGPCSHKDLLKYKSFNRTAMPFGGYEKASKLMTFQLPEYEAAPEEPEHPVIYQHDINSRPCFNRTPIGWVGSGEPCQLSVDLENVPFEGETDDL